MKINEVITEGFLDTLKFVGRAAYQAAGGKFDKDDPVISRANLEYVRNQLGNELYRQFINSLIKQGALTRSGDLIDIRKGPDIVNMAGQFLKQAYRAYIVSPERLWKLDQIIDTEVGRTSFGELSQFFKQINSEYLEMLKDVEATTSANIDSIIADLSKGIKDTFSDPLYKNIRHLIRKLLIELSSKSSYSISVPWSNTTEFTTALIGHTPPTTDMIKLYDETLKAIMSLRDEKKLNYERAAEFARNIT